MRERLFITDELSLDPDHIVFETMTSTGRGGQHAQKNDTRVRLRFNLAASSVLTEAVKSRIRLGGGGQFTSGGELLLVCERHRSRIRNIADVKERLIQLIRQALKPPKKRRPTRPSRGQKEKRLDAKRQQSVRKNLRKRVEP